MQKESVEFTLIAGESETKNTNVALFNTQKVLDFQKLPHPIRMTAIEDNLIESKPITESNPLKKRNKFLLCDGEGKNNFEGLLEAGQTPNFIVLTKDGPNFRVTPIKDWFKFRPYIKSKNENLDEVDITQSTNKKIDLSNSVFSKLFHKDEEGGGTHEGEEEAHEGLDFDDDNADDDENYEIKDIEKKYTKEGKELNQLLQKYGFEVDYDGFEEDDELLQEDDKVSSAMVTKERDDQPSSKKRKSPDTIVENGKNVEKSKKQKVNDQSEIIKKIENEMFEFARKQLQVRTTIPTKEFLELIRSHFGPLDENLKAAIKTLLMKRLDRNERGEYKLKDNIYP